MVWQSFAALRSMDGWVSEVRRGEILFIFPKRSERHLTSFSDDFKNLIPNNQ